MPGIDVSDVLMDPDFFDLVTVTRYSESVSADGISITTPTVMSNIPMTVVATSPAELIRRDDGTMQTQNITVVTTFRLQDATIAGYQPDQITIDNTIFVVKQVLPFSRFGAGFVEAIAEALPPTPGLTP